MDEVMGELMGLTTSDIYVFAEATLEQQQLTWELTGISWARSSAPPMSLDVVHARHVYVAREQHLSQQELSKDGRTRCWVLYLKGYPRQIIASCETTRKTILIAKDGISREGQGYAIASVSTNPIYREQGLAAFLLRHVQEQMDKDSDCSVLYSDIGKSYYSSLGWRVFPSHQATLTLLSSPTTPPGDSEEGITKPAFRHSQPARIRYLRVTELPDLCKKDELDLRKRFEAFPAGDGSTHVAFSPSFPQIMWQLERAEFMAKSFVDKKQTETLLPNKGAITNDGKSWIYWDHDWREKKLKILRMSIRVEEDGGDHSPTVAWKQQRHRIDDIKVLLEAALAEASAWGLPKVLIWNPDAEVTLGCKAAGNAHPYGMKIVFDERKDASIPSLRWAGGADGRDTSWEDNFYYAWC
ncbi:hypothetical protein B0H63DRAFT_286114 [Podospora didyma]|uniref:LYC1 C-terminal domain-containing protein n=1 Tax=Podospora didyma TaxID=330526 RepID=A0AAE0N6J3_9PEZI|nr:hypothetical protein B0H63DRAFT_286114 [Podospora didyma]